MRIINIKKYDFYLMNLLEMKRMKRIEKILGK